MASRTLTVAHQKPGECAYCDERHAAIVAAVAHELAEKIRRAYFGNGDPLGRHATTPVTNAWVAADLIDPEVT